MTVCGCHQIGPHPTGTVAAAGALVRSPGLDGRIPFRRGWAGPQATVALPPLQAGAETSPRWGKPRRGEAPVLPGLSIRWPLPLHDFEPHVHPIRDGESNRLFGGFAREHGADRIPGVVCLYADDMERGLAGLKLAGFVHDGSVSHSRATRHPGSGLHPSQASNAPTPKINASPRA